MVGHPAFRYTGKPFDNEGGLGLYYYGARYYDPKTGRFYSVDPAKGKYPSLSPFIYCANNPLKYVDPDGREIIVRDTGPYSAYARVFVDGALRGDHGGIIQKYMTKIDQAATDVYVEARDIPAFDENGEPMASAYTLMSWDDNEVVPPEIFFDISRILQDKAWTVGAMFCHEFGHVYEHVRMFKAPEDHDGTHNTYWRKLEDAGLKVFGTPDKPTKTDQNYMEKAKSRYKELKEESEDHYNDKYDVEHE